MIRCDYQRRGIAPRHGIEGQRLIRIAPAARLITLTKLIDWCVQRGLSGVEVGAELMLAAPRPVSRCLSVIVSHKRRTPSTYRGRDTGGLRWGTARSIVIWSGLSRASDEIYLADWGHLGTLMPLPPELLAAIAHLEGGRVVLVVGAGCSVEAPTCLPLDAKCASDAHEQLVADGRLGPHDCANPGDLSAVADAVLKRHGKQAALVSQLPIEEFKLAQPNEGHRLAAAMLREGAVSCVLTINFDMALPAALSAVGSRGDVAVIGGPEDHGSLGPRNVIFLHRNAYADPERWILSKKALDDEWKGAWEEAIAARFVSGPVTVFAGLGTPAGVLVETTKRIRKMTSATVYQVDPAERESAAFFQALELPPESYLQMGWVAFMRELSLRLVIEHKIEIRNECEDLVRRNGWHEEDIDGLSERLGQLGLIGLGQLRARWLLQEGSYVPRDGPNAGWLADLVLAVGLVERKTHSTATFREDGTVEFRSDSRLLGIVLLAHGRGSERWYKIDAAIDSKRRHWERRNPRSVLVAGVPGNRQEVTPPRDIICEGTADDLIQEYNVPKKYDVDELRGDPELANMILA